MYHFITAVQKQSAISFKEWLRKIDFRTSLGRKLKKFCGLSSRQFKILLHPDQVQKWSISQRRLKERKKQFMA